jgi:protein-disulfide isomerase
MHKIKHFFNHLTLTTPAAIILGSIIIASGLIGYGFVTKGSVQAGTVTPFTGKIIDDADFVEGKKDSKVVVIEYSDPECPFCVQAHPTIKKLRTDYADKIAFVYRHFPLSQIHPHAIDESKAIMCAGKVGGAKIFYAYLDALFGYKITNQTTQLTSTGKEDIARNLGLDAKQFSECLKNTASDEAISNSTNDGIAAGVQGTPSTFVLLKTKSGYQIVSMVDGARPENYFKAVIEEALTR